MALPLLGRHAAVVPCADLTSGSGTFLFIFTSVVFKIWCNIHAMLITHFPKTFFSPLMDSDFWYIDGVLYYRSVMWSWKSLLLSTCSQRNMMWFTFSSEGCHISKVFLHSRTQICSITPSLGLFKKKNEHVGTLMLLFVCGSSLCLPGGLLQRQPLSHHNRPTLLSAWSSCKRKVTYTSPWPLGIREWETLPLESDSASHLGIALKTSSVLFCFCRVNRWSIHTLQERKFGSKAWWPPQLEAQTICQIPMLQDSCK